MIAVICARSGSKRIKIKYYKFFGELLILLVIKLQKKVKFFLEYMCLQTQKIQKISEKAELLSLILEKKKYSNDVSTLKDALQDFCKNVSLRINMFVAFIQRQFY